MFGVRLGLGLGIGIWVRGRVWFWVRIDWVRVSFRDRVRLGQTLLGTYVGLGWSMIFFLRPCVLGTVK